MASLPYLREPPGTDRTPAKKTSPSQSLSQSRPPFSLPNRLFGLELSQEKGEFSSPLLVSPLDCLLCSLSSSLSFLLSFLLPLRCMRLDSVRISAECLGAIPLQRRSGVSRPLWSSWFFFFFFASDASMWRLLKRRKKKKKTRKKKRTKRGGHAGRRRRSLQRESVREKDRKTERGSLSFVEIAFVECFSALSFLFSLFSLPRFPSGSSSNSTLQSCRESSRTTLFSRRSSRKKRRTRKLLPLHLPVPLLLLLHPV